MPNSSSIKFKSGNFSWINVTSAGRQEIDYLRKKFKFSELDLKDSYARNVAQRPKFYVRDAYSFLILQFPYYDRKHRTIDAEEINFFLSQDFLITVHKENLPPLVELYNACSTDSFIREQYLGEDNLMLLYEIISRLQEYCYPIMDHISIDIKNIEKQIFAGREREMVKEILLIKSNILNFRKIMEAHRGAISKLAKAEAKYLDSGKMEAYYAELSDHAKNIWDTLSGQKEMIEAIEATNASLISFKLNDIMKFLTIISVITFPLTLVAGIFSMRAENGMPFVGSPFGFWIVISIMAIMALSMIWFFTKKKWL